MKKLAALCSIALISVSSAGVTLAAELAPYGTATVTKAKYKPMKIAFSLLSTPENAKANLQQLVGVLKQFGAGAPKGSMVEVVVIGGGVGVFAKENYATFQPQIDAIADMVKGGSGGTKVKVAFCANSMKNSGYANDDMHGFGTIVPAGYIELGQLHQQGYAIAPIENVKARDARYFYQPDLKPAAQK